MRVLAPLLFVLLWSGAFIAVRAGVQDVSPITFLASRFTLAALILLPVCLILHSSNNWQEVRRLWPHLTVS